MSGGIAFDRGGGLAALGAAALLLVLAAIPAGAAEKDLTDKGRVLVEQNCSRCHAIGKEGDSTHPEAPPFRTLSSRYPIEYLAESLAERFRAVIRSNISPNRSPRALFPAIPTCRSSCSAPPTSRRSSTI
jgi:mono/diheme cytochrome c family protein